MTAKSMALRIVTGALAIVWMFLIGSFSGQTGDESGNLSEQVAGEILSVCEAIRGEEYPAEEWDALIEQMQFPVRKLAHMTEYCILALLLALHLSCYENLARDFGKIALFAFGIAVLYAATDELHQRFVPGRSGQITDVGFDAIGAFVGALGCWLVHRVATRHRG